MDLKNISTEQFITNFTKTIDLTFTTDQITALQELTSFLQGPDNIFGFYGFAGTGKTSTIIKFIYYLLNNNNITSISIAAPTNIAVDILKSKFKDEFDSNSSLDKIISLYKEKEKKILFSTVHKLLGFKMDLDIEGNIMFLGGTNTAFKNYNINIIDECSMLTSDIVNQILNDIKEAKGKGFNPKIIFIGDPAQLPPVNLEKNMHNSMVFNNSQLGNFKTVTMKQIVRSNDMAVINMCNEIRKWTMDEIKLPMLKNFRGSKIKYYNYKEGDKTSHRWFKKFIEYKTLPNNSDSNIILTWTNNQTDDYNYTARLLLTEYSPREYEKGDMLIANTFYDFPNLDGKVGEEKERGLYTSEQISVTEVKEMHWKIPSFPTLPNIQIVAGIERTQYNNFMVKINKKASTSISVWNLTCKRRLANKSCNIIVCKKDFVPILEKAKFFVEGCIRDLIKYYTKNCSSELGFLTETIIKPLWTEYKNLYVNPFANISYGNSCTTHKAQGANFCNVFVDSHDILQNNNIKESRKCLYTALTRVSNEIHMLM
jgi:hypothetical protein